ncbi:hypothetical protein LJC63_06400 [Ruminococcaceae bacterium OttesenSCG-928-L11]|nr:hypothetical protein [Ruminococcaceae bacterium OttesenSCG-928-L11]
MSASKTPLGLNVWIPSEKPRMEEFNTDNQIIDEKLRALAAEKANADTVYAKDTADGRFSAKSHSHTKSQITDFPTSLPANGGTAASVPWSGVTGKPSTFTATAHTHTKSQISDFPASLPANGGTASTLGRNGSASAPMTFNWVGLGGQPAWVWGGGTDGVNMYVYNPSNFSVSSAASSAACTGNAVTVTRLQTARAINGKAFNGTSDITITANPNAHNQSAATITAGTFPGAVVAQSNANYTTRQVRNTIMSTAGPSGGASGDIWMQYE